MGSSDASGFAPLGRLEESKGIGYRIHKTLKKMKTGAEIIAAMCDEIKKSARILIVGDDDRGTALVQYAIERLKEAADPAVSHEKRLESLVSAGGVIAAEIDRLNNVKQK